MKIILAITLLAFSALHIGHADSSDKLANDDNNKKYTPTSSEKYQEYCNDSFGFCLDLPSVLDMGFAPDDSGVSLTMNAEDDGKHPRPFAIVSFASAHGDIEGVPHSLEKRMESYTEDLDEITYQKKGDNWFVVSGYKGSGKSIFYKKEYVGKKNANSLYIEYPRRDKALYDGVVNHIVESFKPGDL